MAYGAVCIKLSLSIHNKSIGLSEVLLRAIRFVKSKKKKFHMITVIFAGSGDSFSHNIHACFVVEGQHFKLFILTF